MTEVIEYLTFGGRAGFEAFQERRRFEDHRSIAFWKERPRGDVRPEDRFDLRQSVKDTLAKFRACQDQYLNTVVNLLEAMLSIDPLERPPVSECLDVVSQDIPTDDWPLLDEDEISISGLGTNPQLRNM